MQKCEEVTSCHENQEGDEDVKMEARLHLDTRKSYESFLHLRQAVHEKPLIIFSLQRVKQSSSYQNRNILVKTESSSVRT